MYFSDIIFSGRDWGWPVAGLLALGTLCLIWSYGRTSPSVRRWTCAILKGLGLLALGLCLLEPLRSAQRARPGANLFAILADNSQGMQIRDRGETSSRGQQLHALLDPSLGHWQNKLAESFELRRYCFDARLQGTRAFEELQFDGRSSAIGAALRSLSERFQGRPLAGVLLFTDGNATDPAVLPGLKGLPPVYPVVLGRKEPVRDLALRHVSTSQTDFEDAPIAIEAEVSASGYSGHAVSARLVDLSGKQAGEAQLRARSDTDALVFRFQVRPDTPGLAFYRLQIRAKEEAGLSKTNATNEATLENNDTVLAVDRREGPYRILYVSGRPNWEYKFLNRALQEDKELELVGLIRVAKREPKFTFMGRAGESSNPLFRGFGNQSAEDIERYDQPVLVRLNTRDELELKGGFPRSEEDLYCYQAVVLDDLEAEFFTPDQAALLQRFVSERGGGFIMLGGMETFSQGKYARTPIGDMLPVYLDRPSAPAPGAPVHLNLTREGWLQPWARLRDNEEDEKKRLEGMVPFEVMNRTREVKPGATIIATAADSAGKTFPALVVQRFGRGRSAAFMIGDFWRWGLHDPNSHRDMDKAWRQLMRWLVSDVPSRVELTHQREPNDPLGSARLQVRVRDEKFAPLDNATLQLEVQPVMVEGSADTNSVRVQLEPSATEAGLYEAVYVPRHVGGYRAVVTATNFAGVRIGQAATGWSADPAAEEFRSLQPDFTLMEKVARETGGRVLSPADLDPFVKTLPTQRAPVMDTITYPLWHTSTMFAFALACLVTEWGLRRWQGLP